jgi:hypothetical protein
VHDARDHPPVVHAPGARLVLRQVRRDHAHASSDSQNSDFDTTTLQRNAALERHESPRSCEINPLIGYRP